MTSRTSLPAVETGALRTLSAGESDAVAGAAKVETKVYSLPFGLEIVTWGNGGPVSCWMVWDGEKKLGGGCST